MKYLMVMMGLVLVVVSCSTLTSAERAEREAKIEKAVEKMLAERRYTVDVSMMYPKSGRAQNVTSNYSLEVRGDSLVSYLPYFGTARSVPYGGGKGLVFEDDIDSYVEDFSRADRRIIQFSTNNGEDLLVYTVTVFDTGTADIHVNCRNRDDISYRGTLDPEAYPKDE